MSKTLNELVEIAAEAYPDHFLQRQLQTSQVDVDTLSLDEVLAIYITKEFRELYDPNSGDKENVRRITASLERSTHTLERVTEQLRGFARLSSRNPAQEPSEEPLSPLLESLRPASS